MNRSNNSWQNFRVIRGGIHEDESFEHFLVDPMLKLSEIHKTFFAVLSGNKQTKFEIISI